MMPSFRESFPERSLFYGGPSSRYLIRSHQDPNDSFVATNLLLLDKIYLLDHTYFTLRNLTDFTYCC